MPTLLHEIDSISGAIVNSDFAEPFTDSFDIAKISVSHTINSHLNTHPARLSANFKSQLENVELRRISVIAEV
ncbi:hypothetical protein PS619_05532 [Pseudomonas fluorescens]|nr:hypothetical protein PS619_05532 [Pseudomonas fluorescens]